MQLKKFIQTGLLLVAPLIYTSCFFEVKEDTKDDFPDYYDSYNSDVYPSRTYVDHDVHIDYHLPSDWNDQVAECKENETFRRVSDKFVCVESEDTRWYPNCKSDNCQAVNLNVHYMLLENLGYTNRIIVEAFDNAKFSGSPVSSLEITNFDASRVGLHRNEVIFLEPGEYYFRAFISNVDVPNPYEYQGMELVSETPVGIFGALSGAERVVVRPSNRIDINSDINIYLDKLMVKEGQEIPTNAHLRAKISVPEDYVVPASKKIYVQFFNTDDFFYDPAYEFTLASETLMITGSEGSTEFLSTDLKEGSYYIRAFLDVSGNGYFDDGEPQFINTLHGELKLVKIVKNRTELVNIQF